MNKTRELETMQLWTQTEKGYCAELSDLTANAMTEQLRNTLPNGEVMPESEIKPFLDGDDLITHWEYQMKDGRTATIFND